jgi:V/A-type H+/Na+-transporting ATPase subunit E
MSIENIEKKIAETAQAEAEQMVSAARAQADGQLAAAKKELAERSEQTVAEAKASLQRRLEQQATAKRNENRLTLLTQRADLLGDIFDAAVERLVGDRGGGDYQKWLAAQVGTAAEHKGEIVAAKDDRAAVARLLGGVGPNSGLTMSDETAPLKGGFVVEGEKVDLDLSLDTQLTEIRARVLPKLAKKAFSDAG